MTTDRTNDRSERALRSWFQDGPTTMPDRVIDVVAERIARQPQRSRWRLRGRTPMTTPIKLVAALAAVLVVAVVGWRLLPSSPGVGGQPTVSPSPMPSTFVPLPEGTLVGGTGYRLEPFGAGGASIDLVAPDRWGGVPSWALVGPADNNAPNGIAIGFLQADGLYSDPCHWDVAGSRKEGQPGDIEVGPTAEDLATALTRSTAFEATSPTNARLGGYTGKQLTLQLPGDDTGCDVAAGDREGHAWVFGGPHGGLYIQGPDNQWDVSIVDADGIRVIAVVSSFPGTSEADKAAARAILDSVVITP